MSATMTLSRRNVRRMLATLGELDVATTFDAESLASRLRSLAVASALGGGVTRGRVKRQLVAVAGAVGLVGWLSFGTASAFVGLAATGNLPAPVQNFVSDVLDTVGVEVPRAAPPGGTNGQPTGGTDEPAGEPDNGEMEDVTTTTVPGEDSGSTGSSEENGNGTSGNGNSGNGNGNSGNGNGNSGNGNGNSGNGSSGSSPGNSGNSNGNSGNGSTPGGGVGNGGSSGGGSSGGGSSGGGSSGGGKKK